MKLDINKEPRKFRCGVENQIEISHVGNIHLNDDEIITFITEDKNEYDLGRKSWGFYATPSINGRLQKNNFKTALVKNSMGQFYVYLMEKGKEEEFNDYLTEENQVVIAWLSDSSSMDRIEGLFKS